MQSEQHQDEQYTDPIAPRGTTWRRSLIAPWRILLVDNFTLMNELIWKHSCEILLPAWDCSVYDTTECSGIPDEKVRQMLRVFREMCC